MARMARNNGNGWLRFAATAIVLSWMGWVSMGIQNSQINTEKLKQIGKDVCEIKHFLLGTAMKDG
jgi:hypothetical protein